MSKNYYFSFRVDETEKKKIEKKIKKSKLKKSDYLRKAALDQEIVSIDGLKELALEVSRIGTNINQLARAVNAGKITDTEKLEIYKEKYEEVMNRILELSKL